MATNVCVGDEFEVDEDGNLVLALCGDPADITDPGACPRNAANNAIRRDPDCGLYVIAAQSRGPRFLGDLQQPGAAGLLTQANQCREFEAFFDVANPSNCCDATVTLFVNHYIDLSVNAGSRFQIGSVTSRIQGQQNRVAVTYENVQGNSEDVQLKLVDAVTFTLTAADQDRVFTSFQVCLRTAGDVRVQNYTHDVFAHITTGNCAGGTP